MEMIKDPEEQYEPDGTGTYTNGETTITYDTDGDQHVEVNDD
jgi:hypothetical protein